ncbi:hypothetical protein [Bradyrhizobium sp. UNPF46]|uniref:hypothetical protein n=1 Tax=Bradyrhizobium sp. UNPF46 TaxID=1141168 RepID=UPI0011522C58|nr:hypothetical protein [Bradyrhizobium sp. UNPF46]
MTALTSYSTGTVSVADGGTVVTGAGVIWTDGSAKPGDILQVGNFQSIISDVVDSGELTIPPWGGGAQSGVAYKIWQVSPQRFAGAEALTTVNRLVIALNAREIPVVVSDDETVPDPSLGEDDQTAIQPSTGKVWVMSGGVWTYLGIYRGFRFTGAYSGATTYSVGDVVTDAGSSYIWSNETAGSGHAPPNATYWELLAEKGDVGPAGPAGSGDVDGPTSATDNAAARFDATTGKVIQDSALLIADTTGALSRSGSGGIPVQGSNTNDSAASGYVGEYGSATTSVSPGVSFGTTNTPVNLVSVSLAPGDYDVWGNAVYVPGGSSSTSGIGVIVRPAF